MTFQKRGQERKTGLSPVQRAVLAKAAAQRGVVQWELGQRATTLNRLIDDGLIRHVRLLSDNDIFRNRAKQELLITEAQAHLADRDWAPALAALQTVHRLEGEQYKIGYRLTRAGWAMAGVEPPKGVLLGDDAVPRKDVPAIHTYARWSWDLVTS